MGSSWSLIYFSGRLISGHSLDQPKSESASTRKYLLGRTEVCRTLSVSSEQFARNFGKVPAATSIQQLRDACTAHINYMKLATDGRGVDRHMLGLSNMLQAGEKMPAFLEDVVYKRGSKWLLSTSNLSVSDNTMAGFGPVYVDGYGSNCEHLKTATDFGVGSDFVSRFFQTTSRTSS